MIAKNSTREFRLHVFTEADRPVPAHMIKHELTSWPAVHGPKKAWWYKMQMFDTVHHRGPLLYFDLDVVITGNIDWIWNLDQERFWGIRDFRYLWRPNWNGINSSVMFWNTGRMQWIWQNFQENSIDSTVRRFHGDQDFLNSLIPPSTKRFFAEERFQSWRWQVLDGGIDVKTRTYARPGSGAAIHPNTRVIVFHGQPKPHEVTDPDIQRLWNVQVDQKLV
jgi:lipopolysaccharide biosynthesis glycosyltransferase